MDNEDILTEAIRELNHGDRGILCFDPIKKQVATIVVGPEAQYMIRTMDSGIMKEFPISFNDALINCQMYIEHMMASRSIEEGPF